MYPTAFASVLPIRRQSSVFVTCHRALKVLLPTCRKIVVDPSTCTALPPNALIFTVGGARVSHSCLQSFIAWLRPITLHPAPVSTSQSICSIAEFFALDIHAGRMCSEFLSLSWQILVVSICSFLIETCGMSASFRDMKNGGGQGRWSAVFSEGCIEIGVVFRL